MKIKPSPAGEGGPLLRWMRCCIMIPYNKSLVSKAKELRKNMTREEKHLWYDFLKRLPFTVKRQHNIENYIVDFYIAEKKIVIEIDGAHHFTPEGKNYDRLRTEALNRYELKVLRFSNHDVDTRFEAVCNIIDKEIMERSEIFDRKEPSCLPSEI